MHPRPDWRNLVFLLHPLVSYRTPPKSRREQYLKPLGGKGYIIHVKYKMAENGGYLPTKKGTTPQPKAKIDLAT